MDWNTMWSRCIVLCCATIAVLGRVVDDSIVQLSSCGAGGCVQGGNDGRRPMANVEQGDQDLFTRSKRQSVVVAQEGPKSHRQPCNKMETRKAACLNGECFVLTIAGMRSEHCQCPAKFEGPRCEKLSLYYFLTYSAEMKRAAIIGGVVFGLIVIIVVVSVCCSYRKGRKKREAEKKKRQAEPAASTSFNEVERGKLLENGNGKHESSPNNHHTQPAA